MTISAIVMPDVTPAINLSTVVNQESIIGKVNAFIDQINLTGFEAANTINPSTGVTSNDLLVFQQKVSDYQIDVQLASKVAGVMVKSINSMVNGS